jgi:hypothetical protein
MRSLVFDSYEILVVSIEKYSSTNKYSDKFSVGKKRSLLVYRFMSLYFEMRSSSVS